MCIYLNLMILIKIIRGFIRAKGIFKYLKELGVPASAADITARADQEGWNPGFTEKMVGWAKKMETGERSVIKNPEYFSTYMQEELKALV